MWWMGGDGDGKKEKPHIIYKISVHIGPVRCIQFDAVHIISGGGDASMCITDIATGEVMQTIRAHEGSQDDIEHEKNGKNETSKVMKGRKQVLTLAFDTERIISAGTDNTLRFWKWGKGTGPQDKYHVLGKKQALNIYVYIFIYIYIYVYLYIYIYIYI
jgi:WD40 repeat protein